MTLDFTPNRTNGDRHAGGSSTEVSGDLPVFFAGAAALDAPTHTYLDKCPGCGGRVPLPFYPHDIPVILPFLHVRTRGANCRLLVVVNPSGATAATELPPGVRYEDALGHFRLSPRTR